MRDARLERGLSFVVGIVSLLAMRSGPALTPAPPAPPKPVVVTTRVPMPVPVVIETPEPMLVPTVIVPITPAQLPVCPTPPRADDAPIGAPVGAPGADYDPSNTHTKIAASARAPVIALLAAAGEVSVSDDDGRRFARAFAGHAVGSIAVDERGRVYALGDGGLGVRDARGRERWQAITCEHEQCSDAVIAVGAGVVWIHDHDVKRSNDGGRHWRTLDADGAELAAKPHLFALDGALYGTEHVSEECGWEADQIARIDLATGASTSRSFDNDAGSPKIGFADDAGATWRYTGGRQIVLASLSPAVGGRVLFASGGYQLDELCGDRARAVAFAYGADRVDAVDAAGRPLVALGTRVFRFSTRYGWRELAVPQPPDSGD